MPTHVDAVAAAIDGVGELTDRLIAERRAEPGEDLISALVIASEGSDRLSRDEIATMVLTLVLAGQDSTRCSLGHALATFAAQPDQWELLGQSPDLAAAAAEEVLRVNPVCPIVWRVADVDLDHRDLHLTAGTRIWLLVGHGQLLDSAGNPDPFDITREHRPQLNFGHGPHFCLGAQLARVELAEALAVLARRLPDLALDGDAVYRPELAGFVGAERLPIRFTPIAS
jgi:cytochrome P450